MIVDTTIYWKYGHVYFRAPFALFRLPLNRERKLMNFHKLISCAGKVDRIVYRSVPVVPLILFVREERGPSFALDSIKGRVALDRSFMSRKLRSNTWSGYISQQVPPATRLGKESLTTLAPYLRNFPRDVNYIAEITELNLSLRYHRSITIK